MTRYVIAPVSRLHEGEGVLSQMPRIPISEDSKVNESFFYMDNRLVHEQDGSRILGPYNQGELKPQKEISFFPLLTFLKRMNYIYLFCVLIVLDYNDQEFCFHLVHELVYYQYKRSFHLL